MTRPARRASTDCSYGVGGGRAVGRGIFPVLHPYPDDCDKAYYRARPKRVHIVVSRPEWCEGHQTFTRIGWRAHDEHSHYVTICA